MKRKPLIFIILGSALAVLTIFTILFLVLPPVRMSVTLSGEMPLGAEAEIRSRFPSRVTLTVEGRDGNDMEHEFPGRRRRHRVPVLGLYPGYDNRITFLLTSRRGGTVSVRRTVVTAPLPEAFPDIRVYRASDREPAPGMIFAHPGTYNNDGDYHPLTCALDNYGKVRWFYPGEIGHVLKRLANGNLIIQKEDSLVEIDMLGRRTGKTWQVPGGLHHDAIELPDGNFLALSSAPGSFDDGVVEIGRNTGDPVRWWDFRNIVDPSRPRQPKNLRDDDWLHLNGIAYSPEDDAFIVSGRDQSALIKVDRFTGKLVWILSSHRYWKPEYGPYLLEPDTTPFPWPWGQHAPAVHPGDPDRILVYDNGNKRSYDTPLAPEENYSRAVEYRLSPDGRRVSQVWQYGEERGSGLYTPFIGSAAYLPGGNRLICFGGITRSLEGMPMEIFDFEAGTVNRMKMSAVITEVTSDTPAEQVLELWFEDDDPDSYRGYRSYRAFKMPLYPGR